VETVPWDVENTPTDLHKRWSVVPAQPCFEHGPILLFPIRNRCLCVLPFFGSDQLGEQFSTYALRSNLSADSKMLYGECFT
jgi:hypothetical protein